MAEDDGTDDSVMAGLSNDDIAPNIYEGGFKTWECSMDLASYVNYSLGTLHLAAPKKLHVVEVCPSLTSPPAVVFMEILQISF